MTDHGSKKLYALLTELERRLAVLREAVPPVSATKGEPLIMLQKIAAFNRVRDILYGAGYVVNS